MTDFDMYQFDRVTDHIDWLHGIANLAKVGAAATASALPSLSCTMLGAKFFK